MSDKPNFSLLKPVTDRNIGSCRTGAGNSAFWTKLLLFSIAFPVLLEFYIEWPRYQAILGTRAQRLGYLDEFILMWLLFAKSLFLCLPALLISALLDRFRLRKTISIVVHVWFISVFFVITLDLACVGFAGYHIWDYLPYLWDMFENPGQKIWQWSEGLITESLMVLAITIISVIVFFRLCAGPASLLVNRVRRRFAFNSPTAAIGLITLLIIAGVPGMVIFEDRYALDRVFVAVPMPKIIKQALKKTADQLAYWFEETDIELAGKGLEATKKVQARLLPKKVVSLELLDADLSLNLGLPEQSRTDVFAAGNSQFGKPHFSDLIPETKVTLDLLCPKRNKKYFLFDMKSDEPLFEPMKDIVLPAAGYSASLEQEPDKQVILSARTIAQEAADPGPADPDARVTKENLPNVIMVIFESFRHHSLGPNSMNRLNSWADRGLRLERHYSGSNCSHLGLFSLFYGRSPCGYHQTLDRNIPAQMLESFRASGYEITFLTSGEVAGFRRLDQFINSKSCDNVVLQGDFMGGMDDWPGSDRSKLEYVKKALAAENRKPQFMFFYLVSSHYRYAFPPEFNIFKESPKFWQFISPNEQVKNHLNRYANSLMFLEDELMKLLESIDLKKNMVIITGDHGESMGEDGVFTHATRISEIQLRVPFVMAGAGIKPGTVKAATVHTDVLPTVLHALAGEEIPIRNCRGRDLLAGPIAEEVVVSAANDLEPNGFTVIKGDKKYLFRMNSPEQGIGAEFSGLIDESGMFDWKPRPAAAASASGKN